MKKIASEIAAFLSARNWDAPLPGDVAKSICIESAELLEAFQWGSIDVRGLTKNKALFKQVQYELADVFIYGFVLALSLGLDPEKIIRAKLSCVRKKYPARLMRSQSPQHNAAYRSIKQAYRKKVR